MRILLTFCDFDLWQVIHNGHKDPTLYYFGLINKEMGEEKATKVKKYLTSMHGVYSSVIKSMAKEVVEVHL